MEVIVFEKHLRNKMMIGVLIGILILACSHYYALRSYIIMFPYSYYHNQLSEKKQNDYLIEIPTKRRMFKDGWYPGMMVFHDNKGFGSWVNRPVELTVLYRFGEFHFGEKHSTYFDRSSDRFSSFHGAYIVKNKYPFDNIYGYDQDDEIILSDIMRITEYDQRWLVMPSIGLSPENVIFEVEIIGIEEKGDFIPSSDLKWTKIDAFIITNSPEHHYMDKHRGYLQYGRPLAPPTGTDDYFPVTLAGRIYVTKSEGNDALIALYALAVNFEIIDQIDEEFLSKTNIRKR